jgi:rod shape-determining protein MreD
VVFESPESRHILKPVKPGFVAITIVVAIVFNLLPWRDMRGVPDLVAVVLCFWCIHQPRLVSIGIPFLCGLVMDAANGVLLGQHALAYSILGFLSQAISRRILWFPPITQAVHVLIVLLVVQAVTLLVRMAAGGTFPGWIYFAGTLIAAVLWPLITFILLAPQRAAETDETQTL